MSASVADWKSAWSSVPQMKWGLIVVGTVVGIALMSKWTGSGTPQYSKKFISKVEHVVNKALKYHETAKQDTNPLISLVHATQALTFLTAARQIARDSDVERITGYHVADLEYALETDQRQAMEIVTSKCPDVKPSGVYDTTSTWN